MLRLASTNLFFAAGYWEAVPTEQNPNAKPCTIVRDNNANTCQGCFETDVLVVTRATSNKQSAAAKHKGNTTYIVNTAYNQPSPFYTSSAVGDYQYVNPEYWSKARGLTLLQYCTLPTN